MRCSSGNRLFVDDSIMSRTIVNRREACALQKHEELMSKQKNKNAQAIKSGQGRNRNDHHSRVLTMYHGHCAIVTLLVIFMCLTLAFSLGPSRADLFLAHMMIYFPARRSILDFQNQPVVFDRTEESVDSLQTMEWFDTGLITHQLFDMIWHKHKNVEERDIRLFIGKRECLFSTASLVRNGTETGLINFRFKKAFTGTQDDFVSIYDQQRMELIRIQDAQFEMLGEVPDEIDKKMGAESMETWENCDQEAYEILKPWSPGVLETRAFATDAQKPLAASTVGQIRERRLVELTSQYPNQNFRDKVCHAATTWNLERIYLSKDRITLDQTDSGGEELVMHGIGHPRVTDLAVEANRQEITDIVTKLEISGQEGFIEETAVCGRDTVTNIVGYGILIAVAAYGAQTALIKQILANDRSWGSVSALGKSPSVQEFLEQKLRTTRKLKLKILAYCTATTLAASIPLFLAIRGELCYLAINVQEGRYTTLTFETLEHFKRVVPEANEIAGGENCRPIIDDIKKPPESQGRCDKEPCIKHEEWKSMTNFFLIMSTRPRGSNIVLISVVVLSAAVVTGRICYTQLHIGPANTSILTWPRWLEGGRVKTRHYVLMVALSEKEEGCRIIGSLETT